MEVVNTDFPKGNKFYPIANEHTITRIRKIFSKKTYWALKHVEESVISHNEHLGTMGMSSWLSDVSISGDHHNDYPIFKISSCSVFRGLYEYVSSVIDHKKDNYQSFLRIKHLGNMPWYPDMEIQWDDIRKGFILYNIPYEGTLTKVKGSGISKKITTILNDISDEAGMFELLGESTFIARDKAYANSVQKANSILDCFERLVDGTYSYDDAITVAVDSKGYDASYDSDESQRLSTLVHKGVLTWNDAPASKYYKLVKSSTKPKISSTTRQRLMYKFGGLELPDNYEEWFDG